MKYDASINVDISIGPREFVEEVMHRKDHATCARKRRYFNEIDALIHATYRSEGAGVPLAVYQCPTCGGWHMTSRPQPPRRLAE